MFQTRRTAALAVDAVSHLVGRQRVVRAARFTLNRARLDVPNSASTNGELFLQRWVLASIPGTETVTVFDVGANIGEWSQAMLDHARMAGRNLSLHAFEPTSSSHQALLARLPSQTRVNRMAMSNRVGETTIHVVNPGAGTNSLYAAANAQAQAQDESVATTTVDEYVGANGISRIDLLKVDTEGHDFFVLLGAERSLSAGLVSIVQFEYNHRWVQARRFLKDVFDLVSPLGYHVGKLTPRGMEAYTHWDPELESFVEGNYLACTEQMAKRLPQIGWWKSSQP
jgi:FkbM family methyltransferase